MLTREQYLERVTQRKLIAEPFELFAGQFHNWELQPPIDASRLVAFEAKFDVQLPSEYRQFISCVGNGGAGPLYGLFSFQDDGTAGSDLLNQPFPHIEAWNLEYSPNCWGSEEQYEHEYLSAAHVQGTMRICHFGCGIYFLLICTGPERGNIWVDSRADSQGLYPLRIGAAERCTFLGFYDAWLDQKLKSLTNE
jgi:hypothetical protein